jgi:hypothetical protein
MRSIKRALLLISISLLSFGCRQNASERSQGFVFQPGDLLFQDLDCGPLCDAIEKVTTGYHGANFSHVGIAAKNDGGDFVVIEAVPSGVEITPLQDFLNRSFDAQHQPKVVVGRLKKHYRRLIPSALNEALALKGKPYDKVFAIDNDAYYCSELVYEAFLRANKNRPVFNLQPMTFKEPNTVEILVTWKEYFSKLGIPVPEGQPGINSGSISRSTALTIIDPYDILARRGATASQRGK